MKYFWGFLKILLIVVFIGVANWMTDLGFSSIRNMRELERVPQRNIIAVLPGPMNLSGKAKVLNGRTLQSPDWNKECVYYHYKVEEKTTDSDGDVEWETIRSEEKYVPFLLQDKTGSIKINPSDVIDFNVKQSDYRRSGDRRYYEYRIDLKDNLFVFGNAVQSDGDWTVEFRSDGQYTPIVSEYSVTSERSGMATWSLFQSWAAILIFSMSVVLLFDLFRLHHTVVFLAGMSVLLLCAIGFFGHRMTVGDLEASVQRINNLKQETREAIRDIVEKQNYNWNGQWNDLREITKSDSLTSHERARLTALLASLQKAIIRIREQRDRFPERLYTWTMGLEPLKDVPLPEKKRQAIRDEMKSFQYASLTRNTALIASGAGLLIFIIAAYIGFTNINKKRFMENMPTIKIPGVTYGLNEIRGKPVIPEGEEPLKAPLSEQECIYYHYEVKEKDEDEDDEWNTIVEETEHTAFYCKDDEGKIKVDPDEADISSDCSTSKSSGDRKYTESRINVSDTVYILGPARIDKDSQDKLEMGFPETGEEKDDPYIITNRTESEHKLIKARMGFWGLNFAINAGILLVMMLFGLYGAFSPLTYLTSSASVLGMAGLFFLVFSYNDFVFVRQNVNKAWGNIEVSLKKRSDLLPQLVDVVKQYIQHEQSLLQKLSEIRDQSAGESSFTPQQASKLLNTEMNAFNDLMAVSEDYPELKANENVQKLMTQLVELENEVALMRSGYNKAVERYNVRLRKFPDVMFTSIFGFESEDFLTAEVDVRENPQNLFQGESVVTSAEESAQPSDQSTSESGGGPAEGPTDESPGDGSGKQSTDSGEEPSSEG